MADPKYLRDILLPAKTEIDVIRDFAVRANKALERRKPRAPKNKDVNIGQELRKLSEMLLEQVNAHKTGKKKTIVISEAASSVVLQMIYPIKQRGFLAEMTLSYLASHLEAFLKDYVLAILVRNPNLIKSNATLTYEDVCDFSTIKDLRRELAERHTEGLGRGSIDDAALYFERKFSVSFSDFNGWSDLRECIFRRNLIVHNRGKINDLYRSKVGYTGRETRLSTDMGYVTKAAHLIADFMQYVHDKTGKKFSSKGRSKKLNNSLKPTPLRGAAQLRR